MQWKLELGCEIKKAHHWYLCMSHGQTRCEFWVRKWKWKTSFSVRRVTKNTFRLNTLHIHSLESENRSLFAPKYVIFSPCITNASFDVWENTFVIVLSVLFAKQYFRNKRLLLVERKLQIYIKLCDFISH